MSDWSLRHLFEAGHAVAASNLDDCPAHVGVFDEAVALLIAAPVVDPTTIPRWQVLASHRLAHLKLGSPEWKAALYPNDRPPDGEELHLWCLHFAGLALVRTFARSGFLAFAGLKLESVATHRRTREALVHLELLVDHPSLAIDYWDHARESRPKERRENKFAKAVATVNSRCANPQQPRDAFSPLEAALHDRSQDAMLHVGPHAGLQHGLMGGLDGEFFDLGAGRAGSYALRWAWETVQLLDALQPKLSWIDAERWAAGCDKVRTLAQVVEGMDRERDKPTGPLPPWTSFRQ